MSGAMLLEALRLTLGGALVVSGLVLVVGGAVGLLRFPDFFTRLHAASAADGVGAAVIALGLAVSAPSLDVALKLLLFAALVAVLAPTLGQLAANAAHAAGLAPLAGKYVAPRPGARSEPRA